MTYEATRERLETYFDRTASETWARLTSDAPVSRIRQTVREGRDAMRAAMLSALPADLKGARVLDAGCGAGQMAIELAERGADVVAVDISPSLIEVARSRTPRGLDEYIDYRAGDMLADHGTFDHVVAMDSLIHYAAPDIAAALGKLGETAQGSIVFTIAPKTPALTAMWYAGKLFPRKDRSPAIRPHSARRIARELGAPVTPVARIARGFYISEALEIVP
ncbi:MAG: magnesium protoporphyrin IX methyltransferase [Paracoccaceae bacterium]|nr:magnesium protoporphyrin IX methyltransferase [Paracoccaceae bacterium]